MKTRTRLDAVFEKAFPVPFDDGSKFVFFSDIHRGDDSLSDEFGRNKHIFYHALDYYYQNGFTYVEIGDGDELWEYPNFEVIRSAHTATFEMLKMFYDDNRFYMLFGNHNMQFSNDDYVKKTLYRVYDEYLGEEVDLFPGITVHEALVLIHRDTRQEVFVVHGHQGDLLNDQLAPISHFIVKFFWRFMHNVLGINYAASPAKSRRKRHKVEKRYTKWNTNHDIIIICGHTHRPRFPSPDEPAYFNTGCCMHPRGITCLELIYGKFVLVTWNVHTKRDGSLYIKRTALKGPEPIRSYSHKTSEKG
ncbi:MAG: metallophosphoesterase [Clostridiales bacterium]|nr:metallophosphoesterase [Clostridiales bacterium]